MMRARASGFTLVELAVVLAIVGLLLGIILVPLSTQFELRQVRAEQIELARVRDALLGYAAVRGRLPCPDTDFDGVQDCPVCDQTVPNCPSDVPGTLPYADLGLKPGDAWGRHRLYHVDYDFVVASVPGSPGSTTNNALDLQDPAERLLVTERLGDKALRSVTLPGSNDGAVAVVVSLGSNGYGGRTLDGTTINAPPIATAVDEPQNLNAGNDTYVTRVRSGENANPCDDDGTSAAPTAGFCEFDDLLIWVSRGEFMTRMIQAGRLP